MVAQLIIPQVLLEVLNITVHTLLWSVIICVRVIIETIRKLKSLLYGIIKSYWHNLLQREAKKTTHIWNPEVCLVAMNQTFGKICTQIQINYLIHYLRLIDKYENRFNNLHKFQYTIVFLHSRVQHQTKRCYIY